MAKIIAWLLKYGNAAPEVIAAIRRLITDWNAANGLEVEDIIELTQDELTALEGRIASDMIAFAQQEGEEEDH